MEDELLRAIEWALGDQWDAAHRIVQLEESADVGWHARQSLRWAWFAGVD